MGSGFFYFRPANNVKNVRKNRFVRSFLFAGVLLLGMSFINNARAAVAPVFNGGGLITITVCQNSPAFDIGSYLGITDPDFFQLENWTVVTAPTGTLVCNYGDVSNGGTVTPLPLNIFYTPNPGFTGIDWAVIKIDDGTDGSSTTLLKIVVTPVPAFTIDNIPAVCAGATSTTLSFSGLSNIGPTSTIFIYHGTPDTFIMPPSVGSVNFDVQGAVGGGDDHSGAPNPGNGGRVQGTLAAAPGTPLYIYSGGAGANGSISGAAGGYNGGGNAFFYFFGCGGAGGGATDIRMGGSGLGNRVVVAGGGGGNGWDSPGPSCGGQGGNVIGGAGCNNVGGSHASGGNGSTGGSHASYVGWTPGANGGFGLGGDGSVQGISGGGGGGYAGGGGGLWSGGGGGSSYADISITSGVVMTQGYNIGSGVVSLDYNIPGYYDIVWDAGPIVAGFVNITGATMPSSPISIAVPPTATPGSYTGTIYIYNNSCRSEGYPITIVVNPIPDVTIPDDQAYCNGDLTITSSFTGSVPGTVFNWTNDQPSIGLAGSGSGDINPFIASNSSTSPVVATIVVTPVANGCAGASMSFQVTVNPTPMLSSAATAPDVCDSAIFNYFPTSATPGATFTWFRPVISGIVDLGAPSGSGNPADYMHNTTTSPIAVPYTYVVAANGCSNSQFVTVTVNPTPMLSSSLSGGTLCNNNVFNYTPASLTVGTVFTWNRNVVPGISTPAFTGSNNPFSSDMALVNTTIAPIVVPYIYTLVANGCVNTQIVTVTVNPTPTLNSPLVNAPQCNNVNFGYGPTSLTTGTTFAWSRGLIAGIANLPNSGMDSINEVLVNTSPNPVTVTYTYVLTANGCQHSQNISVIVYPKPTLSSALNPTICNNSVFNYNPTSLTAGTTFTWTRAAVAGISNLAGAGVGNPNETLVNTSTAPVVVTYVFSLMANGCSNNQNVHLTVYPTPMLSSSLTPPAICDSQMFNYNPTSNTAGSTFNWYRAYIPGIYAVASSGTNNPNQQLINSTYVVVDVVYTYTITANGCTNTQDVTVAVNPTPRLNPPFTGTVCSGSPFHYVPTSYTPGALYTWNRPQVNKVNPPTSFKPLGIGVIDETLTSDNTLQTPVYVDYIFRLTINNCTNLITQTVKLKVNPTPPMPDIVVFPPSSVCAGTMFQNFGTSFTTPGLQYTWTATNAQVFATGANNQNALVNFMTPGTSTVTITSNVNGYGCTTSNSYTVEVSGSQAQFPELIYFNHQFICLKNDNRTYQWGYDDAITLASTTLVGEIDQNYNNVHPDFDTKHYWCITTDGDCSQKSYYNRPTGITNVNGDKAELKVYPNPANDVVNVEVNSIYGGNYQVEIVNMLGQKLDAQTLVNRKASINVATLPAGTYLVECLMNGTKIATTRFVKN